jgi:hypothetical protein
MFMVQDESGAVVHPFSRLLENIYFLQNFLYYHRVDGGENF